MSVLGRLRVDKKPGVGQQLREPVGRSGWKPPMHIRQGAERVDPVTPAGGAGVLSGAPRDNSLIGAQNWPAVYRCYCIMYKRIL